MGLPAGKLAHPSPPFGRRFVAYHKTGPGMQGSKLREVAAVEMSLKPKSPGRYPNIASGVHRGTGEGIS